MVIPLMQNSILFVVLVQWLVLWLLRDEKHLSVLVMKNKIVLINQIQLGVLKDWKIFLLWEGECVEYPRTLNPDLAH